MNVPGNPYEAPGAAQGAAELEARWAGRAARAVASFAVEMWRRLSTPVGDDRLFNTLAMSGVDGPYQAQFVLDQCAVVQQRVDEQLALQGTAAQVGSVGAQQ